MIIRDATLADAEAMAGILNAIIAIGGTSAHQTPKTVEDVGRNYIEGPEVLVCLVAEAQGRMIGWQQVENWKGDTHIGTFVQPGIQAKGVGAALFAITRARAAKAGATRILAWIRADNAAGLAYYARMGFVDYGFDPAFALDDGRVVGRVHRRFDLV